MGMLLQTACLYGSLQSTRWLLANWELAEVEESWENSLTETE